ncbi:MAG: efflux RND transporter periplasmic adaptor subunit [Acidobacteria bacterium]|nr:efflux RND transporter periplasmic adaptor subunit [Acidobacteriota bacterium]
MDIKRDTSGKKKLRILYGAAAILAVIGITYFLSQLDRAAPTVESATLWMDQVERGELLLERRGAGTLVPEEVRAITARSAGLVEERFYLPGAQVTDDTVLLRLSNPDVKLAAQDAAWALEAGQADLRNLEVTLATQRLQQRSNAASVRSTFLTSKLRATMYQQLFDEELTSRLELQLRVTTATEAETRHNIEQERLQILEQSIEAQLDSRRTQVQQLEAQYELALADLEALNVRAGIVGVLQEVSVEIGQSVTPGTVLARVVNPFKLKAELRIPETQAKDIVIGQPVIVDIRTATIPGRVSRIDPSASQGTVTVDVELLMDKLPIGARPQLSVDGTVEIERLADVLFVGKPAYGQSNSQVSLFRVTEDDSYAERTFVKLGLSSVNLIEVIEGLKEGDKVILSDMSKWDSVDRVRLR